jgi:hypothetical protein
VVAAVAAMSCSPGSEDHCADLSDTEDPVPTEPVHKKKTRRDILWRFGVPTVDIECVQNQSPPEATTPPPPMSPIDPPAHNGRPAAALSSAAVFVYIDTHTCDDVVEHLSDFDGVVYRAIHYLGYNGEALGNPNMILHQIPLLYPKEDRIRSDSPTRDTPKSIREQKRSAYSKFNSKFGAESSVRCVESVGRISSCPDSPSSPGYLRPITPLTLMNNRPPLSPKTPTSPCVRSSDVGGGGSGGSGGGGGGAGGELDSRGVYRVPRVLPESIITSASSDPSSPKATGARVSPMLRGLLSSVYTRSQNSPVLDCEHMGNSGSYRSSLRRSSDSPVSMDPDIQNMTITKLSCADVRSVPHDVRCMFLFVSKDRRWDLIANTVRTMACIRCAGSEATVTHTLDKVLTTIDRFLVIRGRSRIPRDKSASKAMAEGDRADSEYLSTWASMGAVSKAKNAFKKGIGSEKKYPVWSADVPQILSPTVAKRGPSPSLLPAIGASKFMSPIRIK